MTDCIERQGDDVLMRIHAQPGAKQSAFAGQHGDALKIRLAAPAQEGKANRELSRFLAQAFDVPLAAVLLVSGEGARSKRVRISSPKRWPEALAAWQ